MGWADARNWIKHSRTCHARMVGREGGCQLHNNLAVRRREMPLGRETAPDPGRGGQPPESVMNSDPRTLVVVYNSPLLGLRCLCPRGILMATRDLAGDISVGVISSAVAEATSLADIAEVASSANLAEVASSADLAEVASPADLAGDVTVGVMSIADPAGVVRCEVPCGSVCDYFLYGHYDNKPDYFDYDDPGDYDSYPNVYGFVGPDNYELYHDLHGPGHGPHDCGVYCASRGDIGVVPYWSGDEKGTCMRTMLPCPGLTSRSMGWGIV